MLTCLQMATPPVLLEIWYGSALRCLMTLVSSNRGLECGMSFVIFPNSLGSFLSKSWDSWDLKLKWTWVCEPCFMFLQRELKIAALD